jgi:hypothetical protein
MASQFTSKGQEFGCWLTAWSRALLVKLVAPQLVKKLPHILWNLKVHYHIHKIPPLIHVLDQINPVHALPSYFFKIYFNTVLTSTHRSCKWYASFRFPHLYVCISHPPCFVMYPSHPLSILSPKYSNIRHKENVHRWWLGRWDVLSKQGMRIQDKIFWGRGRRLAEEVAAVTRYNKCWF